MLGKLFVIFLLSFYTSMVFASNIGKDNKKFSPSISVLCKAGVEDSCEQKLIEVGEKRVLLKILNLSRLIKNSSAHERQVMEQTFSRKLVESKSEAEALCYRAALELID